MSIALAGLARLSTSFPSPGVNRALSAGGIPRHDAIDGGAFSISGNVYLKGPPQVPTVRRVRLHDGANGRPVRETWSAVDGAYSFAKIRPGLYYVVAFDHTGTYNAVIKDRIEAV